MIPPDDTRNHWFNFNTGQWAPGVLASANNITLLDRRKLQGYRPDSPDPIARPSGRWHWAVYDTRPRECGAWRGFKSRREAVKWFVSYSLGAWCNESAPRLLAGPIGDEWRARKLPA